MDTPTSAMVMRDGALTFIRSRSASITRKVAMLIRTFKISRVEKTPGDVAQAAIPLTGSLQSLGSTRPRLGNTTIKKTNKSTQKNALTTEATPAILCKSINHLLLSGSK
jgi:hypothetical protein